MKPRLVGLVGRAGAGKDAVGKILVQTGDPVFAREFIGDREFTTKYTRWQLASFAGPLKKICGEVFRFFDEQLHGALKNEPDPRYQRADGTFLTPREAMQRLGTEFGRACYPQIWVEYGLHRAKQVMEGCSVAITDVRFVNEAKAITEAGGEVWRIYRPRADAVKATHPSETEMDTPEMEALVSRNIYNEGTLEDLRETVQGIL